MHSGILNRRDLILLILGDIIFFYVALWLTLFVRYQSVPVVGIWQTHFVPFSILFAVWMIVFFIAGLYEKHTLVLKSRLPSIILHAQIANTIIAVLFFYLIPYFGITPKTNLFIDLIFSSALIYLWRVFLFPLCGARRREKALLIGSGEEMRELKEEVNTHPRYGMKFVLSLDPDKLDAIDLQEEIIEHIYSEGISIVVVDLRNEKVAPILPHLYNLIFSGVRFIDKYRVYEDIFDRVPLSLVNYNWFLENISSSTHTMYDFAKRAMDIIIASVLFILFLPLYPLVALAAWLSGQKVFFIQERVGKGGRTIRIIKFKTMTDDEPPQVTKFGALLRKTRIDELPQLLNVLKGDLSLVGPRPEIPRLVALYDREIPFYSVRHLIKPGLSGWAQMHQEKPPKFDVGYDETKTKLSYDLYYIKNRSFLLDVKIALKTIKILLMRSGV